MLFVGATLRAGMTVTLVAVNRQVRVSTVIRTKLHVDIPCKVNVLDVVLGHHLESGRITVHTLFPELEARVLDLAANTEGVTKVVKTVAVERKVLASNLEGVDRAVRLRRERSRGR